jgi:hypothetical protein
LKRNFKRGKGIKGKGAKGKGKKGKGIKGKGIEPNRFFGGAFPF